MSVQGIHCLRLGFVCKNHFNEDKFQRYTLSAPPGSPEMFAAVAGKREVVFSWSTPVTQHNGVLTSYILTCSPSPSSLPQILLSGPLTVTGFSPHTSYFCSLVAINTQGSGQPALTSFTTLQDCEPIEDHPFHNDVRLFPLYIRFSSFVSVTFSIHVQRKL